MALFTFTLFFSEWKNIGGCMGNENGFLCFIKFSNGDHFGESGITKA